MHPSACLPLIAACVMCLAPLIVQAETAEELLTQRVERIAAELPWLTTGDVIYDREPQRGPDLDKVVALLRELDSPLPLSWRAAATLPATSVAATPPATLPAIAHPAGLGFSSRSGLVLINPDAVRPLLQHDNAKVRTLGIVLLLKLERLDVMPDIAALVDDETPTFPSPSPGSALAWLGEGERPWPMTPTTVGEYARAAVDQYVRASAQLEDLRRGRGVPRDGATLANVFRDMAANRDAFTNTATLRVAMERATGGISPMPGERQPRVHHVLALVHQLPMPRRFFVAHALDAQRLGGERYVDTFLLDLARQVPREVRLAVLNGARPADDPDLARGAGWDYFVANAVDLLRSDDVDLLLELDAKHLAQMGEPGRSQAYASAAYLIAAARLDPSRAESLLIPALDSGRSVNGTYGHDLNAVAAVLAELGGEPGLTRALDWFFLQHPEQRAAHGGGREAVLAQLHKSQPHRHRQFVARVIRDPRLSTLGPPSTRALVRAVQGYSGLPIADEEQIRDSYRIDESQRDRRAPYLPDWHRRLRETMDEWDQR